MSGRAGRTTTSARTLVEVVQDETAVLSAVAVPTVFSVDRGRTQVKTHTQLCATIFGALLLHSLIQWWRASLRGGPPREGRGWHPANQDRHGNEKMLLLVSFTFPGQQQAGVLLLVTCSRCAERAAMWTITYDAW